MREHMSSTFAAFPCVFTAPQCLNVGLFALRVVRIFVGRFFSVCTLRRAEFCLLQIEEPSEICVRLFWLVIVNLFWDLLGWISIYTCRCIYFVLSVSLIVTRRSRMRRQYTQHSTPQPLVRDTFYLYWNKKTSFRPQLTVYTT